MLSADEYQNFAGPTQICEVACEDNRPIGTTTRTLTGGARSGMPA